MRQEKARQKLPMGLRGIGLAVFAGLSALIHAGIAAADEPEPLSLRATRSGPLEPGNAPLVLRAAQAASAEAVDAPGLELRLRTELDWSRLALADDLGSPGVRSIMLPVLPAVDLRDEPWNTTPRALPAVASAIGSAVTRGFSVLEVVKDRRLRQRHRVSAYFRSRGLQLAWRMQF